MAKLNLDLTNYSTQKAGADLVPAANYHVMISSTELIINQMDSSKIRLVLWLEIMSGQYKGSMLRESLNVLNPSEEAERISREALKTYCVVTGHPNPNNPGDSDLLHGKELIVKVDIKPSSFKDARTGEMKTIDQNNVKKILEYTGNAPAEAPVLSTDTPPNSAIAQNGADVFGTASTIMNPTTAAAPAAGKNPWDK